MTKQKSYYSIGDTAKILDVQQHVIRFWEGKFSAISPIRKAGNRRYYSQNDIDFLQKIKDLLYNKGLSIKGVQLFLKKQKYTTNNDLLSDEENSVNEFLSSQNTNSLPPQDPHIQNIQINQTQNQEYNDKIDKNYIKDLIEELKKVKAYIDTSIK